jgi:hypothetical protein
MLGIRIEDVNGVGIFRSDYTDYLDPMMLESVHLFGDRTPIPQPCKNPEPNLLYEGSDFHQLFQFDTDVGEYLPIDKSIIFVWDLDFFHTNIRLSKHFIKSLWSNNFQVKVVNVKKPLAQSHAQIVGTRRKVKLVSYIREPYDFYKFVS